MTPTDKIIADIRQALADVTALDVNTAQLVREGKHYECPFCDDGYLPAKDFTNIDDVALGIQFFGIGKEFGNAEKYLDAVLPGKMRALLAEIELLRVNAIEEAAALLDAERNKATPGSVTHSTLTVAVAKVRALASGFDASKDEAQ